MSDPYGWLDNAAPAQPQQVDDPYAWLDAEQAQPAQPATPSFDIDFAGKPADVRRAIAGLPKDQRKAARRAWADTFVKREREQNRGLGQNVSDTVRNLARGTPIGSFLDEANAFTAAPLSALGITDPAGYEEALAYQRAQDRAVDSDSTRIATLPVVGDVTVGGATKLTGALASGAAAARAGMGLINAFRGNSALPTIGNLAVTGGVAGGVYGAGEGESASERAGNAALGAAVGTVAGPAGYVAGQGIGRAATSVNAMLRGNRGQNALRQYDPAAVRRVQRAVEDDSLTNQRLYNVERGRLGPEGMMLDMGDNLRGQASAIANSPGAGQTTIRGALRARDRLARDRLTTSVNQALGPEGAQVRMGGGPVQAFNTFEEAVDGVMDQTRQAARPLYDQFRGMQIPETPAIGEIRAAAEALDPGIMRRVMSLIEADRSIPAAARANNSTQLDYLRRELANMAQQETGRRAGIAGDLARDLNAEIDNVLQRQGSTVYADARATAREGLSFREGAEEGLNVLGNNRMTAQALRDRVARATPTQAGGLRVGAREDIRRRMQTAPSAFGSEASATRGASQGRRVIASDEARAKLNALAVDPNAARQLVRTADAEGRFAASSQAITGNSATAARQAAQQEFPNAIPTVDVGTEIGKRTTAGATAEAAFRMTNWLLSGALDERRVRIAADSARMLIARGGDRDAIVAALQQRAQQQGVSQAQREAIANVVSMVARSTDPAVVPTGQ